MICPACGEDISGSATSNSRLLCNGCGTTVMPERKNFQYPPDYNQIRGHDKTHVQENKVNTFYNYLRSIKISIDKGQNILEVGFGGGAILKELLRLGSIPYGLEIEMKLLDNAALLGVPRCNLKTDLTEFVSRELQFDKVFYFDSFEHILNPSEHLKFLNRCVKKGSQALLVLPNGSSLSYKIMGKHWPHDVPEHWVFYSEKGLIDLWERSGWTLISKFIPRKRISLGMLLRHYTS